MYGRTYTVHASRFTHVHVLKSEQMSRLTSSQQHINAVDMQGTVMQCNS